MPKIENPLLVSLYSQWVGRVLSETNTIEEANEKLREVGREMGFQLYLSTELAERTNSVSGGEDVPRLIDSIFRLLHNRKPSNVDYSSADTVRIVDKNCIWCQDITLEGMHGFGYCEGFSGVLEAILEFKGVEARVSQELCRATGDDNCTWNIRF